MNLVNILGTKTSVQKKSTAWIPAFAGMTEKIRTPVKKVKADFKLAQRSPAYLWAT